MEQNFCEIIVLFNGAFVIYFYAAGFIGIRYTAIQDQLEPA